MEKEFFFGVEGKGNLERGYLEEVGERRRKGVVRKEGTEKKG